MAAIGELSKDLKDLSNSYYDDRIFKRGEIYYIDLADIGYGSKYIQTKTRPGLIIQNDIGNIHSETVIVALLTTSFKKPYPFQYKFSLNGRDSVIMFEQIMTLDKYRILEKCGELTPAQMKEAEAPMMHSLQLNRLSLENIVDFDVLGVVTRRTRNEEFTYFEVEINFEHNQKNTIQISLNKLHEFHSSITENSDFDEIKQILNCCPGLHWLAKNNMI